MAITFLQGYSNEAGDSAVGWVKAKQKRKVKLRMSYRFILIQIYYKLQ